VSYTSELTFPQFPAGIGEPPNSGPERYTDPPCTLAVHVKSWTFGTKILHFKILNDVTIVSNSILSRNKPKITVGWDQFTTNSPHC
jgi:hypothetical protein